MPRKHKIKNKFKTLWHSNIAHHLVSGVDSANLGVIFLLAMGHALSGIGSFIVFPIAIGANLLNVILSTRDAYLHRKEDPSLVVNAVANTVVALGVIAAVVLTFAGGAALGAVAPAVLTGTLGFKALYDLSAGCFFWYKYHKYKHLNPEKAQFYFKKAKSHTIAFVTDALATAAAGALLIADKTSFGAVGIAAGVIGTGSAVYGGYKGYKKYKAAKKRQQAFENEELITLNSNLDASFCAHNKTNDVTNNTLIHQTLGLPQNFQPNIQQIYAPTYNRTAQQPFVFEVPNNLPPVSHYGNQQNYSLTQSEQTISQSVPTFIR